MFKCGVFLVFISLLAQAVKADITDTIFAIEQVVAKGVKFDGYSHGAKLLPIDSFQIAINQMNSVAELFAQQSLVNVTSYGPGGQAGVKIRGGGSDHTTIVWNGLNLKPPMSGEINYSAINTVLFDEIIIQPGGSSTMYGSGAATGVVFLTNKLNLNNKGFGAGANTEVGSFESYGLNAEGSYTGKKIGTRLYVGYQQAENNFKYKYGNKTKVLEHAAYTNLSVSQQNSFKLGRSSKLETDFWYTKLFKEIPSLISDTKTGKTEQDDENLNFALNFSHYGNNWFAKYRGGVIVYNNSFLGYQDSAFYTAVNKSQSYINEIEVKYSFNKSHKIFLGVNYTIDQAQSDSYTKKAIRNQLDFFGRYSGSFFADKLKLNAEGRQAITDGIPIPFVYSAGVNFELLKGLFIKSSGAKLYSLADLNDLYWTETAWASGNSDLEPEYGCSLESGIEHFYSNSKLSFRHELTIYNSKLNNAIVWLPDTSQKWRPNNLEATLTQGIEFTGKTQLFFTHSSLTFGYDYALTDAKLSDSTLAEDELVQRRYIPKHKAGAKIRYQLKGFSAATYVQFVGERYIDNVSLPLDSYFLLDFYMNYQLPLGKSSLTIYTKFKNLLDTNYQVMAGYAQPGRSVYLGINYKF
jgi:vitamin B12 transporter